MIKFSKSKLNTYISCGEKYRIHYELGIRARKTSNTLVEGSCIHHLVETGIAYGDQISDVLEHASIHFWEGHPFDRCAYDTEESYVLAQALCLGQSREFLDLLGPQQSQGIELHIERPLVHPLTGEDHSEIVLNGFIDLVLVGEDGRPIIVDLKTVARRPQEGMSRLALELSMYAYLMEENLPVQEITRTNVALVYLIRTKLPQLHWDSSFRTLHHLLDLYATCRKVADDINQAIYYRNPGMHCGYCDSKSLCYHLPEQAVLIFGEENWQRYIDDMLTREQGLPNVALAANF